VKLLVLFYQLMRLSRTHKVRSPASFNSVVLLEGVE